MITLPVVVFLKNNMSVLHRHGMVLLSPIVLSWLDARIATILRGLIVLKINLLIKKKTTVLPVVFATTQLQYQCDLKAHGLTWLKVECPIH